jgi:hypothetical protein
VFAETDENVKHWKDHGLANCGFAADFVSKHSLDTYDTWLSDIASWGLRNIGPASSWDGWGGQDKRWNNNTLKMAEYINKFKNNEGVAIWTWADEADGADNPPSINMPLIIRKWTDVCHEIDTDHPHYENMLAYQWSMINNADTARDYYEKYRKRFSYLYGSQAMGGERKPLADIIGFDYYVIEYGTWNQKTDYTDINYETLALAMDRMRYYNYDLLPLFLWNENCDLRPDNCQDDNSGHCVPPVNGWSADQDNVRGTVTGAGHTYNWTPAPKPYEMWAEYWIKVIHGAKGFHIHNAYAKDGMGFDDQKKYVEEVDFSLVVKPDDMKELFDYLIKKGYLNSKKKVVHYSGNKTFTDEHYDLTEKFQPRSGHLSINDIDDIPEKFKHFQKDIYGILIGPKNYSTMKRFLTWMNALKGAILGPDYDAAVTISTDNDGRIDIMTKYYDGAIYIIAANLRRNKQVVRFTVNGLSSHKNGVEVFDENRKIDIKESAFSDSFDSLGVHIYKILTTVHSQDNGRVNLYNGQKIFCRPISSGHYLKVQYSLPSDVENVEFSIFDLRGCHVEYTTRLTGISGGEGSCFVKKQFAPGYYLVKMLVRLKGGTKPMCVSQNWMHVS